MTAVRVRAMSIPKQRSFIGDLICIRTIPYFRF